MFVCLLLSVSLLQKSYVLHQAFMLFQFSNPFSSLVSSWVWQHEKISCLYNYWCLIPGRNSMNSLSFHIYQENISISSPPKIETISMIQCILENDWTVSSHHEILCHLKLQVMPTACSSKAEKYYRKIKYFVHMHVNIASN